MLGDVLLRRHARIPANERIVRFLVLAPERRELARHKLESSPVLRAAMETGNWHVVLWPHLRAWLEREPPDLVALDDVQHLSAGDQERAMLLASLWGNRADLGFRMGLSPKVPDVLARHVGRQVGGGPSLASADVFVNLAGGIRVDEPGAD